MKQTHFLLFISMLLLLTACAKQPETVATLSVGGNQTPASSGQINPGIEYGGGDGLTMTTAVVILHAKGEKEGVRAEYHWISVHHPDWKTRGQALLQGGNGIYDKIVCVKPDGKTVDIFFDISGFFGKW